MLTRPMSIADPVINAETQPFWSAASDGRFVLPRCAQCGRFHWYPRSICPFCFADAIAWIPACGEGVIHSFSIMRRTNPVYAVAYVKLREGPLVFTNIVESEPEDLAIGRPVTVTYVPASSGQAMPVFRLA